jgi:hypothetical protein
MTEIILLSMACCGALFPHRFSDSLLFLDGQPYTTSLPSSCGHSALANDHEINALIPLHMCAPAPTAVFDTQKAHQRVTGSSERLGSNRILEEYGCGINDDFGKLFSP